MKRLQRVLGMLMIAAVLIAQPGCSFLMGKAAMAAGKHVYKKLKEDKEQSQRDEQTRRDADASNRQATSAPAQE
jgi:hypothetical protein